MSILLITNIIIKKERNLLFMELLSTAISYLNTYLLEKFSQKKYSTKLLVIFTITFLSFMLWQIYSGYSKALKLTSIIVSLPLISLISELIIPTFLSLFFISIIKSLRKIFFFIGLYVHLPFNRLYRNRSFIQLHASDFSILHFNYTICHRRDR